MVAWGEGASGDAHVDGSCRIGGEGISLTLRHVRLYRCIALCWVGKLRFARRRFLQHVYEAVRPNPSEWPKAGAKIAERRFIVLGVLHCAVPFRMRRP